MVRHFFIKCIAVFLSLSLLIGQGPLSTAIAIHVSPMDYTAIMSDISYNAVTSFNSGVGHEKGCCSHSDKSSDMKNGMCVDCLAPGQVAMLANLLAAPIQYSLLQGYPMANTSVIDRDVLPEPPYPKA
jgi:hypothetical protein